MKFTLHFGPKLEHCVHTSDWTAAFAAYQALIMTYVRVEWRENTGSDSVVVRSYNNDF